MLKDEIAEFKGIKIEKSSMNIRNKSVYFISSNYHQIIHYKIDFYLYDKLKINAFFDEIISS